MQYYVYILSNSNKNVIYTGVTNDLVRRVYEHKKHLDKHSFTSRYNVENLVYDTEGFTIYYYSVKEYHISTDGTATYFQTRSYIKVR